MDELVEKKKIPVLTIIAGILCILAVILLAVYLYFLFSSFDSNLAASFLFAPVVAIVAIVFAALCGREKKRFRAMFLTIDIIALAIGLISYPLAGYKIFYGSIGQDVVDKAKEKATIENVLKRIPEKNLTLHTKDTDDDFLYFDDDGLIAKQFLSMEFTDKSSGDSYPYSDIYFELDGKELILTFAKDFDGVVVYALYGNFFGYSEAYTSYSIDPIEGKKIQQMIIDKVSEEKNAYQARESEVRDVTSLPSVLEAMNEGEPKFQCTLLDKKYEVGITRQIDDEKVIFNALEELDSSTFLPFEGKVTNTSSGFYYNNIRNSDYYIMFYDQDRCLKLERKYIDPYGKNRNLNIYYLINEEDGNHIMRVARNLIEEKEQEGNKNGGTS